MKKILLLILFSSVLSSLSSQRVIDFIITFQEPYPKTVGELINNSRFDVTILNDVPRDINLYFKSEIRVDGAQKYTITTQNEKIEVPVMTLMANDQQNFRDLEITLEDLGYTFDNIVGLPPRYTELQNITNFENTYLDEGMYSVCITAFDWDTDTQLSAKVCNLDPFIIEKGNVQVDWVDTEYDCGNVVDNLFFNWNIDAVANGNVDDCFEYDVTIARVPDGSNPLDAINDPTNHVILGGIRVTEAMLDNSNNDFTEDLFPKGQYAVQIKAIETIGSSCTVILDQDDASPIFQFSVSCDEEGETSGNVDKDFDCESCLAAAPEDTDISSSISSLEGSFLAGYYSVFDLDNITGSNSSGFSGQGKVKFNLFGIDNIPVLVEFSGVKLNKDRQMFEGEVKTILQNLGEYPSLSIDEDAEFTSLAELRKQSPGQYDDFVSGIQTLNDITNDISDYATHGGFETPLGFDQSIDGDNYKFLIDNIVFQPEGALINISLNFPMPFQEDSEYVETEDGLIKNTKYFAFAARSLCLTPDGTFGPGTFPVVNDIDIISDNDIDNNGDFQGYALKINGNTNFSSDDTSGSFLNLNCDGISGVQLDCSLLFPEKTLIPKFTPQPTVVDDGDNEVSGVEITEAIDNRVTGRFTLFFGSNNNPETEKGWLTSISISPFTFSKFEDWTFEVQKATIDLSKSYNISGMVFPNDHNTFGPTPKIGDGYFYEQTNETEILNQWTGIFVKEIHIVPPRKIRGNISKGFKASNLVIDLNDSDETNYSCSFEVEAPYKNQLDIEDWKLTIEKLKLQITNRDFVAGGLEGRIYAPFVHSQDYFVYDCLLYESEYNEVDFLFKVSPPSSNDSDEPYVRIPMWIASANLSAESNITIDTEGEKTNFSANLIGKMHLSEEGASMFVSDKEKLKSLPIEAVGLPFFLSYSSKNGFDGSLGITEMLKKRVDLMKKQIQGDLEKIGSLTSGEAFEEDSSTDDKAELAGFTLTFLNASIGGTLNNPKLSIQPKIHLMTEEKEGFGVDADIFIEGIYEGSKYKLDRLGVNCAGLDVQLSKFSLSGEVCFEHTDNKKEFRGAFMVDSPGGFAVAMRGAFGTKYKANKIKDFNYFYLRALGRFKDGVELGAGISLYGIGGGILWNCKYQNQAEIRNLGRSEFSRMPILEPDEVAAPELYNAFRVTPDKNKFRFEATGLFGLSGDPETFNFDATLALNLDNANSSFDLDMAGKFYVMQPMYEPPTSPYVMGNLYAKMDVQDISAGDFAFYTVNTDLEGNVVNNNDVQIKIPNPDPIIKGEIWYDFALKPKEQEYHLWIGAPTGHTALGGPGELGLVVIF